MSLCAQTGSDGNANLVTPSPARAVLRQLAIVTVTAWCVVFLVPKVPHTFFRGERIAAGRSLPGGGEVRQTVVESELGDCGCRKMCINISSKGVDEH